ncbi:uncharacterized protein EDB91DRAFT_1302096 [Suillus paluster]|uniref:uncharacterized protein n=1 Tax=Suillus paluster TaxID=48578 RepID=UPI001B868062|nr:uncharacterized protein EDB91DRAFT_1302096 [Suillus paluster]KAG1732685.1 hypothetical protein EDB91DRAFT_1302096 [Suillus paluster]
MLPVSVEESKAQRLQRQQARFRDRGGAFVPSEKNTLKDILLARTVSGESPSKAATKSPHRHRSPSVSPSKAKRNKTTTKPKGSPAKVKVSRSNTKTQAPAGLVSGNAAAGPSTESGGKVSKTQTKKKASTTRKGKGKIKATDGDDVPEVESAKAKPAAKRKGRPPKTKTIIYPDIDADPEPSNRKVQTSKAKAPDKSKVKAKLAEVSQSDDEGTLVEAPRPKARSKRKPVIVTIESDDESVPMPDNQTANAEPSAIPKSAYKRPSTKDAPLNHVLAKKCSKEQPDEAAPIVSPTKVSRARKHSKRTDENDESPNPVKTKTYGSLTVEIPMKKSATSSKRSAPDDDVGGDAKHPTKKAKVINLQSAKSLPLSNSAAISKPAAEDPAIKKPHSAMKKDTKRKKERPPESDEDSQPKKPVSKKARFDEESKLGVQISSEKQKENTLQSRKPTGKSNSKPKFRGPPKVVLDRIKASATLHRVVDDSEPDPLDCLS